MQRLQPSFAFRLIPLAALLVASGCANLPSEAGKPVAAAATPPMASASAPPAAVTAVAAARPASAASGVAPAATPPVPGQPPAFAVVIKDAKKIDGLITMYQKDEKVWFELKPSDFGKPLYLSPKLASGIGEARLYAGQMAKPHIVEFRRVHNQVQLIAPNTDYVAKAGRPEARATAASFPASLLGSTAVASQPHPERKTVLIEAVPLFVTDMLGVGAELGRTYRQGYGLDRGNSAITSVRGKPDLIVVETMNHYATPVIAQPVPGAPPTVPQPSAPRTPPDPRSMFINVHYSLAALPATPMAGRPVDGRLGHFPTSYNDFSDDLARTPRVRNVLRWRLEKKDPAAEMSEPVKPITYWIDKNVPLKYRDSIRAGILEWNKAFEKIGFKDAIRAEIQPDNADFDTLDFGIASVRWI
ncbi:MAG: DUF5117 domain-containing protein, partial [Burkholderiales bacterium]|nr:DUF5117 domain-containing protein [Burkholderiales bacterium]